MVPAASVSDRDTSVSFVGLLGEARATIVRRLRREPGRTVAELADGLGVSTVAARRHLAILEQEGLVTSTSVNQGRGRPVQRWDLTDAAGHLLPHRYDAFAAELLAFLVERHGPDGFREFLRWRMEREVAGLSEVVTAEGLHERLDQLSAVLSRAGFDASVQQDGPVFTLIQGNCAIEDVAREHPEVCAYEAASFSKVLGRDVSISRRSTMASGAHECVCTVAPRSSDDGHDLQHASTPGVPAGASKTDGGVRR